MRRLVSFALLLAMILTGCASPTSEPTVTVALTSTKTPPPPTQTPIPTPTLHPEFAALQKLIADADGDIALLPNGHIEENGVVIPSLQVNQSGEITILVAGESIVVDSADITFEEGFQIKGYELEDGEWVEVVNSENTLTYKNYEGQEVTVELATYQYTNAAGEVIEVEQPPDQLACLKYLADRSRWYPRVSDQAQLNRSMGQDESLHELLAEYDIPWPPEDRNTWIMAYPLSGGHPFMTVFVTGWEGGTLAVGQEEDGTYFPVFCEVAPDKFSRKADIDSAALEYQYLQELAVEHQE